MTDCFFTIQGRDAMANQRFNSGDDDWLLTLTGADDWAAQGRVDDLVHVYTDEKIYRAPMRRVRGVLTTAHDVYPTFVPLDWVPLGEVQVRRGLRYLNATQVVANLTSLLSRGDVIVVGNETHEVDNTPSAKFDASVIPLASPFRSASGTYKLWLAGRRQHGYLPS